MLFYSWEYHNILYCILIISYKPNKESSKHVLISVFFANDVDLLRVNFWNANRIYRRKKKICTKNLNNETDTLWRLHLTTRECFFIKYVLTYVLGITISFVVELYRSTHLKKTRIKLLIQYYETVQKNKNILKKMNLT